MRAIYSYCCLHNEPSRTTPHRTAPPHTGHHHTAVLCCATAVNRTEQRETRDTTRHWQTVDLSHLEAVAAGDPPHLHHLRGAPDAAHAAQNAPRSPRITTTAGAATAIATSRSLVPNGRCVIGSSLAGDANPAKRARRRAYDTGQEGGERQRRRVYVPFTQVFFFFVCS